jgi:hypothetical protein
MAFDRTMTDADFIAEAVKRDVDIVNRLRNLPPDWRLHAE